MAELCRAARAAGPGPGSLMAQVLERQQEQAPAELALSAAPLPPTEHVVDEGAAPEGTGYEILLQVMLAFCKWVSVDGIQGQGLCNMGHILVPLLLHAVSKCMSGIASHTGAQ